MNCQSIKAVESFRDLGILVDCDLTFQEHIANIVKQANQTAGAINRSFICQNTDFKLRMYTTFVRPKLEFGTTVWSPSQVQSIKSIESVQRKFTKYLSTYFSKSYVERCNITKLEPLLYRRAIQDLCMVFKLVHGLTSGVDANHFFLRSNSLRGHEYKFTKLRGGSHLQQLFSHRIVDLWNRLPRQLIRSGSVKIFRSSAVDNHPSLIESYCNSLYPNVFC